MSISATTTFDVIDSAIESATVTPTVMPPVGVGTGRGRLIHPTYGIYDYANTPNQVVNLLGALIYTPTVEAVRTLGGAQATFWARLLAGTVVTERWTMGDVGCSLPQATAFLTYWMDQQDVEDALYTVWYPSYASDLLAYNVLIQAVRVGPQQVTSDLQLAELGTDGYVPGPVELQMLVLSAA